jgi:PEP-CTERM motif-containing protein
MKKAPLILIMLMGVFSSLALADTVTFTGSSGSLAASVTFTVSGSNLDVTFINTSTADPVDPTSILSAVLWDMTGSPTLGKVSANSCATCSIMYGGPGGAGGDVGGEWGYLEGSLGGGVTQQEGLSSMGGGNFGTTTRFNTNELQGPPSGSLDGIQYGIAPTTDTTGNDNGGLSGEFLVVNEVDFVLSGLPGGFSAVNDISNVRFQYGTSFDETNFPGGGGGGGGGQVPEPGTIVLLGSGLLLLSGSLRKKLAR